MRRSTPAAERVPTWSTPWEAIVLIACGVTFRTGIVVAVVVGTILSLVNQGAIMLGGDASWSTYVRILVNYVVPFLVSSAGYLAPFRVRRGA